MFNFFDKTVDRVGYLYGTAMLFAGTSIMGVISGWLSTGVEVIGQFGWFGWWIAALSGAALTALVLGCTSWARYSWVHAKTQKKWAEDVDHFNPLDRNFRGKRILLSEIAHPITQRVKGKKLYECELIGPANVFSHRNILFVGVTFFDCTFIVLWPDKKGNITFGNAVVLEEVEMHGGAIYNATILIPPQMNPTFKAMGVHFASLTGDPTIDSPLPTSTEENTPR